MKNQSYNEDDLMEMFDVHVEKIAKDRDFWKRMYFELLASNIDYYENVIKKYKYPVKK